MPKPNGGPAFPQSLGTDPLLQYEAGKISTVGSGMTLRDWFAGQYIAGRLGRSLSTLDDDGYSWEELAAWAYQAADALLAEREK